MLIPGARERVYRAQPNRRFKAARNYNFFDQARPRAIGLGLSNTRDPEQGDFTELATLW
jgi:hypothetical protein